MSCSDLPWPEAELAAPAWMMNALSRYQLGGRVAFPEILHNIKDDKIEGEPPCFDAKQPGLGREIVHHATHDHVHKGIGPQGRDLEWSATRS